MSKSIDQPFSLRMPQELRERAEKSASENLRSLNNELVYQLQKVYSVKPEVKEAA